MSQPPIMLLLLAGLALATFFVAFKIGYSLGQRQGASDTERRIAASERLKNLERSAYEHSKN